MVDVWRGSKSLDVGVGIQYSDRFENFSFLAVALSFLTAAFTTGLS